MEKANAIEEYFIDALSKAIEKKNEAELQFVIAQKEYDEVLEAYKQYTKENEMFNKRVIEALRIDGKAVEHIMRKGGKQ